MKSVRDKISHFYVGRNDYGTKYIMPKIGETKQTVKARVQWLHSHIKVDKNFEVLGYLVLKNVTKAERKLVESTVRVAMEKYGRNVMDDHFLIRAKAKKHQDAQYAAFALVALCYAMDFCDEKGYKYELKII